MPERAHREGSFPTAGFRVVAVDQRVRDQCLVELVQRGQPLRIGGGDEFGDRQHKDCGIEDGAAFMLNECLTLVGPPHFHDAGVDLVPRPAAMHLISGQAAVNGHPIGPFDRRPAHQVGIQEPLRARTMWLRGRLLHPDEEAVRASGPGAFRRPCCLLIGYSRVRSGGTVKVGGRRVVPAVESGLRRYHPVRQSSLRA